MTTPESPLCVSRGNVLKIIEMPSWPTCSTMFNTKGYASAYLAVGSANVRAGTCYPPEQYSRTHCIEIAVTPRRDPIRLTPLLYE